MNLLRHYSTHSTVRSTTLSDIYKIYHSQRKISVITAHDYLTATMAEDSNADMVLIGDSLAMTAKGHPSTLQLELDDFIYSAKSVAAGINTKFLIADLPFGSFEASNEQCVNTAIKLMQLGKISSIKIEGCYEVSEKIKLLTDVGIPVMGHLGLQPQKFNLLGGYKAQGRSTESALEIYKQAVHLQSIGCKMLLLECVPEKVAKFITDSIDMPTIGIGSGAYTSGQVLVVADALGMQNRKPAKFVKQYAKVYDEAVQALNEYDREVKEQSFPSSGVHTYKMDEQEYEEFVNRAKTIC